MAAYISVPRDLTRVKSKILFGLTKRQIVCFGTGALIGVPVYFFVRGSGNLSLAALAMIVVMLPFFFFGMYERNGRKRPTKQCTCQAQSPSEKIVPWSGCVFLRPLSKIHGLSEKIH